MRILYANELAGLDRSNYVEITIGNIGDSWLGPWHSMYTNRPSNYLLREQTIIYGGFSR